MQELKSSVDLVDWIKGKHEIAIRQNKRFREFSRQPREGLGPPQSIQELGICVDSVIRKLL